MRILFLYEELMGYTKACLENYSNTFKSEIYVIQRSDKKVSEYQFESSVVSTQSKSDFLNYRLLKSRCITFDPDIVLVSGRMDRDFVRLARYFKSRNICTVTLQDTQYAKTIRQSIIRSLSWWLYRRNFNVFWGAGSPQYAFGVSLGFPMNSIYNGFYCASEDFRQKQKEYPLLPNRKIRFLSVARLVKVKNLLSFAKTLNKAMSLRDEEYSFTVVGSGPLEEKLKVLENVEVVGFMQPDLLIEMAANYDVFVLPSIYEPWGLVVQEFASMGFPLLLSDKCGASSLFLEEGRNGFGFDSSSEMSVIHAIHRMLDNKENFRLMGVNSVELSQRITLEDWTNTLDVIIKRHVGRYM